MGWTSQYFTTIIIEGSTSQAGIFIYNPSPGNGTLIGSWAAAAGTDVWGNSYPAGINVNQGQLSGVTLSNVQVFGALINNAIINSPQITTPSVSGGVIIESSIVFDTTGGQLLAYSSSTTTVSQTVGGNYNITFPAGVSSAFVQGWGADAGGGGGTATIGGEGAGAGEYAAEPNYAVISGVPYSYTVGSGGTPGVTGSAGTNGSDTFFDGTGVYANGGDAGGSFVGGIGGTGSTNTVHHDGGNGGGDGTQSTGGCGAGGRAGSTGPGGNGAKSTSSSGAAGGTAGTGTGGTAGGAGGNAGSNGHASGGGAGTGTGVTSISKQYHGTAGNSYFGSDASSSAPPNGIRSSGSSLYQGGETASGGSFNGTQKSMILWPYSTIQSDFAGATVDSCTVRLNNLHSWYNSGLSIQLGYTNHSSLPSSYNGTPVGTILWSSMGENTIKTFTLVNSYANELIAGTAKTLTIGPGSGAFNLNYYGYFYGVGGSNNDNPMLTINGHIGAGATTAGAGNDGRMDITYVSSLVLVCAVSPLAGTDSGGNAYAAGFTGTVQAFHPGSSPAVVETWQTITVPTSPAGLSGTAQVRAIAESGFIVIDLVLTWTAATTWTFTLPTGYSISGGPRIYSADGNSAPAAGIQHPRIFSNGGSSFQLIVSGGAGSASWTILWPGSHT